MSETLAVEQEPELAESENSQELTEPKAYEVEAKKAMLDAILTSKVSANADKPVICPWLGNSVVTLGEAMRAYPRPMIDEDPYVLLAVVEDLLANEPESKDGDQISEQTAGTEEVPQDQLGKSEPQQHSETKKTDLAQGNQKTTPAEQASQKDKTGIEQKADEGQDQTPNLTGAADIEAEDFQTVDDEPVPNIAKARTQSSKTSNNPEMDLRIDKQTKSSLKGNLETDQTIIGNPVDVSEEEIIYARAENVVMEPESPEASDQSVAEDSSIELSETDSISLPRDVGGEEKAIPIAITEEVVLDVEDSLVQLSINIESSEAEVMQVLDEVREKIHEIVAEAEGSNRLENVDATEAKDKLKKLFIEHFESLGIEYSPELIDALVNRALKQYFTEDNKKIEDDETTDAAIDRGTRETIKKILARSSTIQRAMRQASLIGKSILQLYSNSVLVDGWINGESVV